MRKLKSRKVTRFFFFQFKLYSLLLVMDSDFNFALRNKGTPSNFGYSRSLQDVAVSAVLWAGSLLLL